MSEKSEPEVFYPSAGHALIEAGEYGLEIFYRGSPIPTVVVDSDDLLAIEEFLIHRRDTEIGRWRDPVHRDLVMYPEESPDMVRLFDESLGMGRLWYRDVAGTVSDSNKNSKEDEIEAEAASRYFETVPERKPWDYAMKDDIWVLTDGEWEGVFRCGENGLYSIENGQPLERMFVEPNDGHRIWPEWDERDREHFS